MPRPARPRALLGAAVAIALCLAPGIPLPVAPAGAAPLPGGVATADSPDELRVMSRNLYLGADVGVALELLPDMPAAAQFMWDQVAATDFSARVGLLAAEAALARPDVIGLQEATIWECRPSPWSSPTPVYDFTQQFLDATRDAGVPYVVASAGDEQAVNPGYSIPAIPFLTTVYDPPTFQPLFGKDSADCGFVIGDALLVREDLAGSVAAVGTSEYDTRYAVVPVVFTIDRGYAWADLARGERTVRVVTTHLESLFTADGVPASASQAQQLVADLAPTTGPLVVMGDFNADPRDPRADGVANPGGQPAANAACTAQPEDPTAQTADAACSAYWTMVDAGFTDAGPDAQAPANWSWGAAGDLAGPDPARLPVALAGGNDAGFTDRLDYVFVRNGASATAARVIGNRWPQGPDLWACDDPSQVQTTQQSSAILAAAGKGTPITGQGVCLPTDHAGLVVQVDLAAAAPATAAEPAPDDHQPLVRISLLGWLVVILGVLVLLVVLVVWGLWRLATRGRRRRRHEAQAMASPTAGP